MRRSVATGLGILLVAGIGGTAAEAAEIRFKPQCQPSGTQVLLGDLAEIIGADEKTAQALAALDLMPAPPPGTQRFVTARQVGDLLRVRGVNLAPHRFSGASQITVGGALPPKVRKRDAPQPSRFATQRARARVREAIVEHLCHAASDQEPWQVDVALDPTQVASLADPRGTLRAEGGSPPWVGRQIFLIRDASSDSDAIQVAADVSLPPYAVVTVRSLPMGATVRSSDVQLVRDQGASGNRPSGRQVLQSLEQVVGLETVRALPAGQVVDQASVRQPLLVRRRDVVTVYARTAGISVRTTARAREDGSRGELVMVESLTDRRRYLTRVTGIREVDVLAGSVRAGQQRGTPGRLASAP
jgi:flagella basal body P-ring formation protein FlgA